MNVRKEHIPGAVATSTLPSAVQDNNCKEGNGEYQTSRPRTEEPETGVCFQAQRVQRPVGRGAGSSEKGVCQGG